MLSIKPFKLILTDHEFEIENTIDAVSKVLLIQERWRMNCDILELDSAMYSLDEVETVVSFLRNEPINTEKNLCEIGKKWGFPLLIIHAAPGNERNALDAMYSIGQNTDAILNMIAEKVARNDFHNWAVLNLEEFVSIIHIAETKYHLSHRNGWQIERELTERNLHKFVEIAPQMFDIREADDEVLMYLQQNAPEIQPIIAQELDQRSMMLNQIQPLQTENEYLEAQSRELLSIVSDLNTQHAFMGSALFQYLKLKAKMIEYQSTNVIRSYLSQMIDQNNSFYNYFDGLFNTIQRMTNRWADKYIKITSSVNQNDATLLTHYSEFSCWKSNNHSSWVQFDFGEAMVELTGYVIYFGENENNCQNWKMSGKKDGQWIYLHGENLYHCGNNASLFKLGITTPVSSIKFDFTDTPASIRLIELFGSLKNFTIDTDIQLGIRQIDDKISRLQKDNTLFVPAGNKGLEGLFNALQTSDLDNLIRIEAKNNYYQNQPQALIKQGNLFESKSDVYQISAEYGYFNLTSCALRCGFTNVNSTRAVQVFAQNLDGMMIQLAEKHIDSLANPGAIVPIHFNETATKIVNVFIKSNIEDAVPEIDDAISTLNLIGIEFFGEFVQETGSSNIANLEDSFLKSQKLAFQVIRDLIKHANNSKEALSQLKRYGIAVNYRDNYFDFQSNSRNNRRICQ